MMPAPLIAAIAATLLLSACTGAGGDRIAGAEVDEGGFGDATRQNMLVMSAEGPALAHLGARFAAEVPSTITFAFDSAELGVAARTALDEQARFMLRFPEVRFSVYGHADEVGSASYNEALGLRRARVAVAYLVSRGVSAERLAALVSYGETRPVVPSAGAERANRRTVTTVTGFVATSQMVLDGKYAQLAYRRYVTRFGGPAGQAGSATATTLTTVAAE